MVEVSQDKPRQRSAWSPSPRVASAARARAPSAPGGPAQQHVSNVGGSHGVGGTSKGFGGSDWKRGDASEAGQDEERDHVQGEGGDVISGAEMPDARHEAQLESQANLSSKAASAELASKSDATCEEV
jgi:hypothetical protein